MRDETLNERLERLGFHSRKATRGTYKREIISSSTGQIVFTGDCFETTKWLNDCLAGGG